VRSSTPVQSATAATVVSSPPESEPQKRWKADRVAAAEGDAWQQDPARTMNDQGCRRHRARRAAHRRRCEWRSTRCRRAAAAAWPCRGRR
jgi:hypothetical protein